MQGIHAELASTYSIVAFDGETGEMGVGVQSHFFAVGAAVPWILPGVGAVATQSLVNKQYGPDGLELLRQGTEPEEVVRRLTEADPGARFRQLAVLSADGRVAAYTGERCIREACHVAGEGFSVQANMMERTGVCEAMAEAFSSDLSKTGPEPSSSASVRSPLARRILSALHAAEGLGGDIRGRQSAAIMTARTRTEGHIAEEFGVNIRVDDHPEPLGELQRLLDLHTGYLHLDEGDERISRNDFEGAMEEYRLSLKYAPNNPEMRFWRAVALLQQDHTAEGFELLGGLTAERPAWFDLALRLEECGMAHFPEGLLDRFAAEHPETRRRS